MAKSQTISGNTITYEDKPFTEGGMKVAHWDNSKSNVVLFYKKPQNASALQRVKDIVTRYNIPQQDPYFKNIFSWPTDIIQEGDKLGLVVPTIDKRFFFNKDGKDEFREKGTEKNSAWFTNPRLRVLTSKKEHGNWQNSLYISIYLSRGIRRMHSQGLAHSDLSYRNVLIDPATNSVNIIDVDNLVVPNLYPPEVLGTPDFIAPEVLKSTKLDFNDKNRIHPSRFTDLHSMAVLIYQFLLNRHPYDGPKIHDVNNAEIDNYLKMGEKALFIEHPRDTSNRPTKGEKFNENLPYSSPDKIPFQVLGPYLAKVIEGAFINGLHNPSKRPIADDWETALIKTLDITISCSNSNCEKQYFPYTSRNPICPFCNTKQNNIFPLLNLYYQKQTGNWTDEKHRIVGYHNRFIFPYHTNRALWPNERLTEEQRKPVGYFSKVGNIWHLVNQNIPEMTLIDGEKRIPIPLGKSIILKDKMQIMLSRQLNGRLFYVQF